MVVKKIHFEETGREKLKSGIQKMKDAVGSTMGPMGRTVLIESEMHIGGITTTKDGVTVAKSINLYDPVENLAVVMMREAAEKTATSAGDGTTTAIVLAEAMITEAEKHITPENNRVEVTRHMTSMAEAISNNLEESSIKVEGNKLYEVATVSANNDEFLGKMIGDAYAEVGVDGIVTVGESKTTKTHCTITKGMHFDRGFMSRFHLTDLQKQIVELNDPYILVTDLEIPSFKSIMGIMEAVVRDNRSLLVIGEVSMDFAATLNNNVAKGKIKAAQVLPPNFGYRREEMMEDLASAVGGRYISEKTGSDWGLVTVEDLGRADRVVIEKDGTSIIQDSNEINENTKKRIHDIKVALKGDDSEESQEFFKERLAMLSGKVATIHVGGKTSIEQKEKKDRVDDAVLATRAALEMGILPGGGIALMDEISPIPMNLEGDELTAKLIMDNALMYPFHQIVMNAGEHPDALMDSGELGNGSGYDPKTRKIGNMIDMGIIDPTKVTINALQNATSVATTILMTSAIITNVREDESSR
jgi:chaperonin GroEL